MAKDGYRTVRLTGAVYAELKSLQDDLVRRGSANLPKPLVRRAEVTSLSGIVSLAVRATREHLKDYDDGENGKDETHGK